MSTPTLDRALEQLRNARTPQDLFGPDQPAGGRAIHAMADAWRSCAARLWLSYKTRPPVNLRTCGHAYDVGPRIARGDLADLYTVTRDGVVGKALLKVVRDPAHNFLMDREALALRLLAETGEPRFQPYAPRLLETFTHRDERTGAERRVNVLEHAEDFISLAELRHGAATVADITWIRRRLQVALEFAHRAGVTHGAVRPEHILIHPELHGLKLVGWCHWGGSPAIDHGMAASTLAGLRSRNDHYSG